MKLTSDIKNITIIVLLILGSFLFYKWITQEPRPDMNDYIKIGGKEYKKLSEKRDTIYQDTIIYKEKRVPVPVKEYIDVPIPVDVDTLEILKDFYTKRVYSDTLLNIDGEGSVATINDTISQNRIISRTARFDIKNKTITETIIVETPPRVKVFVGPGVDIGYNYGANGSILIKNKKDQVLQLQGGLQSVPGTNDIKPYVGLGIYWKIKLRRE